MAYSKNLARKAAAERQLVDVPEEPMVPRMIRMPDRQWTRLKTHFRSRGMSVSAGIRMVLHDWMADQGIR